MGSKTIECTCGHKQQLNHWRSCPVKGCSVVVGYCEQSELLTIGMFKTPDDAAVRTIQVHLQAEHTEEERP